MTREAWRVLHRWSGIVLAIPLLVAALTGVVISFHHEVDRWLNPGLFVVEARATPLPLDAALDSVRRLHEGAQPGFVRLPQAADESIEVDLDEPVPVAGGSRTWTTVFLDPYDARVLGGRDESGWRVDRAHLVPLLYRLHYTLGAGDVGLWIMGLASGLWTISALVGLALAVPRVRLLRRALTVRRSGKPVAFAYDWHRALGVGTLVLTTVVAFTGFYMALPELVEKPMIAAGLELADPRRELAPSAAFATGRDVGWAAAVASAREAAPAARPFGLALDERRGYYQVRMIDPDDVHVRGTRRVMVDAGSGEVAVDWSQLGATPAEKVRGWQFPLHTGQAFGEFGRWLASAVSLATAVLVIAGVALFALRRERRRVPAGARLAQVAERG